jgi:F-type H+-transporting ATPase subunit b
VTTIFWVGLLFAEGGESAAGPFGLSMTAWQLLNLVGFLGVLLYFVARPITNLFRQRQMDIVKRLEDAQKQRAQAVELEAEIHRRLADLEGQLEEIRVRGVAEGEAARAALIEQAERDAEAVVRNAEELISRRLDSAKDDLRRVAAQLTTQTASEIVSQAITEEDRRRLFAESLRRLGEQK